MSGRKPVPAGPQIRELLRPHLEAITALIIQIRNDALWAGQRPSKRMNRRRAIKLLKKSKGAGL